jgi:hypothetical protein
MILSNTPMQIYIMGLGLKFFYNTFIMFNIYHLI